MFAPRVWCSCNLLQTVINQIKVNDEHNTPSPNVLREHLDQDTTHCSDVLGHSLKLFILADSDDHITELHAALTLTSLRPRPVF